MAQFTIGRTCLVSAFKIETERLILRELTMADLDRIHEMRSDPDVAKYIGADKVKDRSWNEKRLKFHIDCYAKHGFGMWGIIWKETGEMIGWAGLQPLEDSGYIEVGYGMVKEYWGKGIGYEAGFASLKYGFEVAGLEQIVAVADPANNNSWGIMKKLRMTQGENQVHYGLDLVFYSITRKEFLELNK